MKWNDYCAQYRRHLPDNPKAILEVGIWKGDGLRWLRKTYPHATIVGVDINITQEAIEAAAECGALLVRGSQRNIAAALNFNRTYDIIIDDASHRPYDQSACFKQLFPRLNDGGVYAIEDMHMGQRWHWRLYSLFFGIRPLLARMVARMNYWQGYGDPSCFRSPKSIIFTPGLVLIQKGETWMELA